MVSAWVASWHVHGHHQHTHSDPGDRGPHLHAAHVHGSHCHPHGTSDHSDHVGHVHLAQDASQHDSHTHHSGDVPWTPEHSHDDCHLCQFLAQHFGLLSLPLMSPMVELATPLADTCKTFFLDQTVRLTRSRGPPATSMTIPS